MLRRNPQTGAWERRDGDTWVPAQGPEKVAQAAAVKDDLDAALEGAFSDGVNGGTGDVVGSVAVNRDLTADAVAGAVAGSVAADHMGVVDGDSAGAVASNGQAAPSDDAPGSDDRLAAADDLGFGDLPGLTSGDGSRGTVGGKTVRERLLSRRAGARAKTRAPQSVQVSASAARASGPAVKDGTAARQQDRLKAQGTSGRAGKVVAESAAVGQRYIQRAGYVVGPLEGRARWVQDLFEAHFRSGLTLAMRREFNRIKLSRADYAIGWLTLLDKIKEDPSILRLEKNGKE